MWSNEMAAMGLVDFSLRSSNFYSVEPDLLGC